MQRVAKLCSELRENQMLLLRVLEAAGPKSLEAVVPLVVTRLFPTPTDVGEDGVLLGMLVVGFGEYRSVLGERRVG